MVEAVVGFTTYIYNVNIARNLAKFEAEKSKKMALYLTDIFRTQDPYSNSKSDNKLENILDIAYLNIDTQFKGDTATANQLKLTLADIYRHVDKYDAAKKYMQK